jgi:hypothetical protein
MFSRPLLLALLQCSIGIGCGGSSATTCTTDDQCASHFCKLDGTCGPAAVDAPPGTTDAPIDGTSAACTPNHDGQITLAELPLVPGRSATFRIATNATWDTAGHANGDGSRSWDLTGQLSGDADHMLALASPAGAWWQADFASATYATTLSSSSDLLGVFALDASGLTLLGVVSPAGGATRTELTYDPPAKIVALPIAAGATWSSTSTVSGLAQGVGAAYTEKYASRVDQVGTLAAPYGTFPVLRIATDMTRTSGLATLASNRTFTWAAECFGFVATVTSQSFETGSEFSNDAEVSRLAP